MSSVHERLYAQRKKTAAAAAAAPPPPPPAASVSSSETVKSKKAAVGAGAAKTKIPTLSSSSSFSHSSNKENSNVKTSNFYNGKNNNRKTLHSATTSYSYSSSSYSSRQQQQQQQPLASAPPKRIHVAIGKNSLNSQQHQFPSSSKNNLINFPTATAASAPEKDDFPTGSSIEDDSAFNNESLFDILNATHSNDLDSLANKRRASVWETTRRLTLDKQKEMKRASIYAGAVRVKKKKQPVATAADISSTGNLSASTIESLKLSSETEQNLLKLQKTMESYYLGSTSSSTSSSAAAPSTNTSFPQQRSAIIPTTHSSVSQVLPLPVTPARTRALAEQETARKIGRVMSEYADIILPSSTIKNSSTATHQTTAASVMETDNNNSNNNNINRGSLFSGAVAVATPRKANFNNNTTSALLMMSGSVPRNNRSTSTITTSSSANYVNNFIAPALEEDVPIAPKQPLTGLMDPDTKSSFRDKIRQELLASRGPMDLSSTTTYLNNNGGVHNTNRGYASSSSNTNLETATMATATEAADSFDSYSVDGGDFSSSIQSPSVHHKYHHQQQQQQQHHQFPKLPSLRQAMASLENNLHNNHTSLDYATSSPAHHVVPTAVAVAPPLPPTSLLHVGTSSSQQQLQKQLRQPYYGNYPDLSIPPPRISTTTSILSTNSIAPSVTSSSSSATTILPAPPSLSNSSPSLLSSLESKFAALGVDQVHGIESTYPVPSNNAITSSSSSSSSTGGSRSLRINDLISSNRTFATNINNTSLPSTKSDVRVRSPPPPSTHPGSSTTSSTSSTSSAMIENLINLEDITSLDQLEELERLLSGMVEK